MASAAKRKVLVLKPTSATSKKIRDCDGTTKEKELYPFYKAKGVVIVDLAAYDACTWARGRGSDFEYDDYNPVSMGASGAEQIAEEELDQALKVPMTLL